MPLGKKMILWGTLGVVLYFLLSYHFIFIGRSVKMLKKSNHTLEYTFFSVQGKSIPSIMAVDPLREDGIGDLLVELGRMSEEEKERLTARYEDSSR